MYEIYNFCIKDNPNYEDSYFIRLFLPDDKIIWLEPNSRMPDVLVAAGIYESKSKARNDGWNQDLPKGWYDRTFGKRRITVCIWNPTKSLKDYDD